MSPYCVSFEAIIFIRLLASSLHQIWGNHEDIFWPGDFFGFYFQGSRFRMPSEILLSKVYVPSSWECPRLSPLPGGVLLLPLAPVRPCCGLPLRPVGHSGHSSVHGSAGVVITIHPHHPCGRPPSPRHLRVIQGHRDCQQQQPQSTPPGGHALHADTKLGWNLRDNPHALKVSPDDSRAATPLRSRC
jgi:hypothetical protein